MSDIDLDKVAKDVSLGLLTTGNWIPAKSEHNYMKLRSIVDGIELRIDLTPREVRIYPINRHLAETAVVDAKADDILAAVAKVLRECRATLAK